MQNVTFLAPFGATFSHDAYDILAGIHEAPEASESNYIPASSNSEVLKLMQKHGGYGAIAIETLAEARVAESLESFIELLKTCPANDNCPFHVVGAVRLKIHFCLMVRAGLNQSEITRIVSHPKGLGACKNRIARLGVPTATVTSNGEAARLVAQDPEYANCAALGPRSAAEKYGLKILNDSFEDSEAVTTFFLLAPKTHKVITGKENRILIVYKVPHKPGALVRSLLPFEQEGLNLIHIHSVHVGNHSYNFAIEIEVKGNDLPALKKAMQVFEKQVDAYISFGPFEVLTR